MTEFRTRRDLVIRPRLDRHAMPTGKYIAKDPIAMRYWLLAEHEIAVLRWLNESVSFAEIKRRLEQRFAPKQTTMTEVQSVVAMLHGRGLVVSTDTGQAATLSKRGAQWNRQAWLSGLNPLMIRLPGVDPTPVLNRLRPQLERSIRPLTVLIALILMVAALFVFFSRGELIRQDLPAASQWVSWRSGAMLLISLAVAKLVHEFGHAVAATRLGGRCHEIGLGVFFFAPCLYCDTTECWMLGQRWRRIMVAMGGVLGEALLASLAVFVWMSLPAGTARQQVFYLICTCTVVSWMINLNPLLRYDGYYVLSDLLEEPNLGARARDYVQRITKQFFCPRVDARVPRYGFGRGAFLIAYRLAAFVYRTVVIGLAFWLVLAMFGDRGFLGVGVALIVISAGVMVWPIGKGVFRRFKNPRGWKVSPLRVAIAVGLLVGLGVFVWGVVVPRHLTLTGQVQPAGVTNVYVTTPGRVSKILVVAGQDVIEGQAILVLENPDLSLRSLELAQQLTRLKAELELMELQPRGQAGVAEKVVTLQAAIQDKTEQSNALEEELNALVLRAANDGMILDQVRFESQRFGGQSEKAVLSEGLSGVGGWYGSALSESNVGAWMQVGTVVAQVGSRDRCELVCPLGEEHLADVRRADHAVVWSEGSKSRSAERLFEAEVLGSRVASRVAGDVGSKDNRSAKDEGMKRLDAINYDLRLELSYATNPESRERNASTEAISDSPLWFGAPVEVRVRSRDLTLGGRVSRWLHQLFLHEN